MEWWQIYIFLKLDSLRAAFIFSGFFSFLFVVSFYISKLISYDLNKDVHFSLDSVFTKKRRVISFCVSAISALAILIIPTTNEVSIIIANHWATHNEEMKKLPDNVLKTLNHFLEKAQK